MKFSILGRATAVGMSLLLVTAGIAIASSVDESIVDATAPTGSVTLAPGGSGAITINLSVTGRQASSATFDVYRDWSLSGGSFSGSNPQTFTVPPRPVANDPATTFSTTGTITVDSGQADGTFTLVVGAFNIVTTAPAALALGASSDYDVTVETPTPSDTTDPDTSIDSHPSDPTNSTSASFSFSGTDDTSDPGDLMFECSLDGASFAGCTSPQVYTNLDDGSHTFLVRAIDEAGNVDQTPASFTWLVDTVEPVITDLGVQSGTTGNNGWYTSTVLNRFSASDGTGSGLDGDCSTAFAAPGKEVSTSTNEGSSVSVSSGSCTDNAGNTNSGISSADFMIDLSDPTATITTPPAGAEYTLNQVVNAAYSCSDAISGIDSCVGNVANGSAIDTSSVGSHSFGVTATDNAGRTGQASHSYSVIYTFTGFFQPVDNNNVCNKVKAGQAIPIKFSLGGYQGMDIIAVGYPKASPGSCSGGTDAIEEVVASTAGQSTLQYDAATDQYTYVWKTDKAWATKAILLTVRLADGTDHTARFIFTK